MPRCNPTATCVVLSSILNPSNEIGKEHDQGSCPLPSSPDRGPKLSDEKVQEEAGVENHDPETKKKVQGHKKRSCRSEAKW